MENKSSPTRPIDEQLYLLLIQADFLVENSEFEKAIIKCNTVLTKHPENQTALYYRGLAHQGLGNMLAAKEDFSYCIYLDADFEEAQQALNDLQKEFDK
jgi:tetratricopeptide (TPR) repeat protein